MNNEYEYELLDGYKERPYRVKFRTDKLIRTGTFCGRSPQDARDNAKTYLAVKFPDSTILAVYSHKDHWQKHINWEELF